MTLIETQQDRTDLPLVAIPSVFDDMIEPLREAFPCSTASRVCTCTPTTPSTRTNS